MKSQARANTPSKVFYKNMGLTYHKACIYLRYVSLEQKYYVGSADYLFSRYSGQERAEIVAAVSCGFNEKLLIEQEAIDFCLAFGLPLHNKTLVIRKRNTS